MITVDCRNTLIRDLQCKYADHISKVSKGLAFRKKDLPCLKRDAILARQFISMLYCYTTFTSDVTAAFSILFVKEDATDRDVVELFIDGVSMGTYTGSGTQAEIAQYFYNEINDNSTVWHAEFVDNTLYVWSYDTNQTYADVISITSSNNETTITYTSLEDNLEEILDIWNCIPYEDICNVYEFASKILKENCNCNC